MCNKNFSPNERFLQLFYGKQCDLVIAKNCVELVKKLKREFMDNHPEIVWEVIDNDNFTVRAHYTINDKYSSTEVSLQGLKENAVWNADPNKVDDTLIQYMKEVIYDKILDKRFNDFIKFLNNYYNKNKYKSEFLNNF